MHDNSQAFDRSAYHCPLCRANDATPALTKNGYTIVRCSACGLLYVHPIPTDAELAAHYQQHSYFEGDTDQGYSNYTEMEKALLPHFSRRLRYLTERLGGPGRLLDFGCASGCFLALAQQAGWQVTGVELSQEMARIAAERVSAGGGRVLTTLDALGDAEFDVVTLWEVIEHLPRPVEALTALAARLRLDGLLMLSTPNTAHWQAQRTPAAWGGYRPPSHLLFFTPATLKRTLEAGSLVRVEMRPSAPRPPLPGRVERFTAPLQARLADGSARPWTFWLYLWRAIRMAGWGWQRLARPEDDVYATLEAVAVRSQ